ncbi:MAG TPA: YkgJ family cysteine cluster protein [Candidatus Atribacteria bacterium]|nr:YkgJ family cysteine cluster protein [Candidatus Atribacteria bacterium]
MPFQCIKCGKCCRETEMPLTLKDLKRISSLGYKVTEFAIFNGEKWKLKNINGHCYFLDEKLNLCKIYPYRPEGCKIYPVIYIENEGVGVDDECPMAHTLTKREIKKKAPKLLKLIWEIEHHEENF